MNKTTQQTHDKHKPPRRKQASQLTHNVQVVLSMFRPVSSFVKFSLTKRCFCDCFLFWAGGGRFQHTSRTICVIAGSDTVTHQPSTKQCTEPTDSKLYTMFCCCLAGWLVHWLPCWFSMAGLLVCWVVLRALVLIINNCGSLNWLAVLVGSVGYLVGWLVGCLVA